MKISRHFIFTFKSRKANRTYGGEEYVLAVYENKGKGKLTLIGDTEQTTRSHCGFETEAFHVVLRNDKRLAKKLMTTVKGFNGYWYYTFENEYGIKLQQI